MYKFVVRLVPERMLMGPNGEKFIATHYACKLGRKIGLKPYEIAVSDKEPKKYRGAIVAHEISELWALNNQFLCPRLKYLADKYKLTPHEVGGVESVLQLYLFRQPVADFWMRYRNFDYYYVMSILNNEGICLNCPYWYV
ncbi:hypothetical protein [Caldisericum sp.]|uniref:hypothetical protein n=1 Tax=Caldisericum sp. TaxID=2499687 RepID=UPI003D1195B5